MQSSIQSHSGVDMPRMLYGTAWKKERTAELVAAALKAGFCGIDTACQPRHYHEPGVGEAIRAAVAAGINRSEIFVQTKFTPVGGQDLATVPYDPAASLDQQVLQSFKVSQKNLGTEVIDSLIVHSPLPRWPEMILVWRSLEDLVDRKLIRQIGISNCYDPGYFGRLFSEARIKPAILQNRFYGETGYDVSLRSFCAKHQIVYQSFWTLTANPQILAHPEILRIAASHQATSPQVFFAYLMQRGIQPLTGTQSPQHMREDLAAIEIRLTDSEMARIGEVGKF